MERKSVQNLNWRNIFQTWILAILILEVAHIADEVSENKVKRNRALDETWMEELFQPLSVNLINHCQNNQLRIILPWDRKLQKTRNVS